MTDFLEIWKQLSRSATAAMRQHRIFIEIPH